MPTLTSVRGEPWRRRLYLPAYQVGEAARYAGVPATTAATWHYRNVGLSPVLPGRERRRPLSYLELVELAIVAVFRQFGVPLKNIKTARDYFKTTFSEEYPFTTHQFKTDGFHLVLNLHDLDPTFDINKVIVADQSGQLGWSRMMEDKLYEFDYDQNLAIKWHVAGRNSPVVIDPRVSFGAPVVSGIPTWAVKGRYEAGESLEDISEDFSLERGLLIAALNFEGIEIAH